MIEILCPFYTAFNACLHYSGLYTPTPITGPMQIDRINRSRQIHLIKWFIKASRSARGRSIPSSACFPPA